MYRSFPAVFALALLLLPSSVRAECSDEAYI